MSKSMKPGNPNSIFGIFNIILIVFMLYIAIGMCSLQKEPLIEVYHPESYVDKVNLFIKERKIIYNSRSKKIELSEELKIAQKDYYYGKNDELSIDYEFYRESLLRKDIENFNTTESIGERNRYFIIKDNKLERISPYIHNITMPFLISKRWNGRLFYRYGKADQKRGVLISMKNGKKIKILQSKGYVNAEKFESVMLNSSEQEDVEGLGVTIHFEDGPKYIAELKFFGDDVYIKNTTIKSGYEQADISINGESIGFGYWCPLKNENIIAIEYGEDYHEEFRYSTIDESILISERNNLDKKPYYNDDDFWLGKRAGDCINQAIGKISRDYPEFDSTDFDVYLTVDKKLQSVLSSKLNELFSDKLGSRNVFRASITVMDTKSGEIRALATFPNRSLLENKLQSLSAAEKESIIDKYVTNQRLEVHPIGSVGKIFISAAILNRIPELYTLKIKHFDSSFENMLGLEIIPPLTPQLSFPFKNENYVDFDKFIKYSSNLYICKMGLLSLAYDENLRDLKLSGTTRLNKKSYFQFENRLITFKPNYEKFIRENERIPGGANTINLGNHFLVEELNKLFDVEVLYSRRGDLPLGEDYFEIYNPFIYKPVFEYLKDTGNWREEEEEKILNLIEGTFSSASPASINLQYGSMRDLGTELMRFYIGQNTNEWTDIKLTEALSRIITGKRINASIVSNIVLTENNISDINNSFTPFEDLLLDKAIRTNLLNAMKTVQKPGGTADELWPKIGEYKDILVYGKTGTPKRRDEGPNSAVYLFSAGKLDDKQIFDGLTTAIYIEDQGGSDKAVNLARGIFDHLAEFKKWQKK